jgi:hypothetical protein
VEAAAGSQDRRIGLRGRKKTFRAHFVVAEDVILVGSLRKPIFHYLLASCLRWASGSF